jgi:hypothetical protein
MGRVLIKGFMLRPTHSILIGWDETTRSTSAILPPTHIHLVFHEEWDDDGASEWTRCGISWQLVNPPSSILPLSPSSMRGGWLGEGSNTIRVSEEKRWMLLAGECTSQLTGMLGLLQRWITHLRGCPLPTGCGV